MAHTPPDYTVPDDGSGGGSGSGNTSNPTSGDAPSPGGTITPGRGWKPPGGTTTPPATFPVGGPGDPVGSTGTGRRHAANPGVTTPLPPATVTIDWSLLPKQSKNRPTPNGRTDTFTPTDQPLPFIYGKARCGGQIVYVKVLTTGELLVMWLIGWGPVNSLSNITVDGKDPVAVYGATLNTYTGTTSQVVDPMMAAAETTWTSGLPGIAYAVGKFPKPTGTQPAPNVKAFIVDVQGRLVRDPRSDATLFARSYKDNPALCVADYQTSDQFGGGLADPILDWSGAITTAANDCDTIIDGGSLKRYTIGLWAGDQKDYDQWVTDIRSCGALVVVFNSGLWQIWMEKAQSAVAVTVTDAGTNANINNAGPITVKGAKQVWTRVKVNFTDIANGYKPNTAMDEDPALGNGTVDLVEQTYDFPGVPTYDQARRLARQYRKRSQKDKLVPIRLLQDGGMQLLPGVRVPVTSVQLNWSAVDALCTQISPSPDGYWDAQFELYDANVYDDTVQTTTGYAPPLNPSPYDVPPDVVNATLVTATTPWSIYWDPPTAIATNLYNTTFWSQTNCGNYDGTKVNDGNTAVKAFDVNVAADSTITFDAGVGVTHEMRWLLTYGDWVGVVEFSDNGSSWTGVSNYRRNTRPTVASAIRLGWDPPGQHRYWRARKGSSIALAIDCFEMQWGEGGQVSPYIKNYILSVYPLGGPKGAAVSTIAANALPTVGNPLALFPPLASIVTASDGTISTGAIGVDIAAVTEASVKSAGVQINLVTFGAAAQAAMPYVPTNEVSLSLVNGANQNVAIDSNSDIIAIVGPTGVFSIGGLTPARAGQRITFYNTVAQAMTINNEDGGSTAATRITTFTGGNIALAAAKSCFTVIYSAVSSRWILISARDNAGAR